MFNKFFTRFMPMMEGDGGAGGGTGGSGGSGGEGGTGGNGGAGQQVTPEIDYEKLAGIIQGKQSASEDAILKAYFKNQGLNPDEAKQAIAAFKEEKAKNTPDVAALQQQAAQAQQEALTEKIKTEAIMLSQEIGVDLKTMPYLLKMADLSEVAEDGKINNEKLKEALGKVLEDVPQLKVQVDDSQSGGFRFGSSGGGEGKADDDALKNAFGL